ncbi:MAG: ABC transporter permease subunit [Deltaproteobacteria bacterium]|nr:ABC transporter permease subunit [Deltaproteobacteria bacterium]
MPIRDLGYRPYEGERLPPSHNMAVLLRHGLRRAWGSWLVKIAAFLGWVPTVVALALLGLRYVMEQRGAQVGALDAGQALHTLTLFQLWPFITMVTLGAGAGVISRDLTHRAFQFYFSKPVTPTQYLVGRTSAVAIWCFFLIWLPSLITVVVLVGTAPAELRLERLGLMLPATLDAALIAAVCATASVGISSLSRSRAFSMSAWLVLLFVPHVLAQIVFAVGDWPWLRLASIPALLSIVGEALYRIEPDSALRWYHALPVLAGVMAGAITLAMNRLRHTQVIS